MPTSVFSTRGDGETVFGSIRHGGHVEQAVIDTLRLWMPTYLREAERQSNRAQGVLLAPRSYTTTPDRRPVPERYPGSTLPAVIVAATGAPRGRRAGQGQVTLEWQFGVAVVVSAATEETTRELAHLYGWCCAAIVEHHPSLGGVVSDAGMELAADPVRCEPMGAKGRSLALCAIGFECRMPVLDAGRGPLEPDPEPAEEAPEYPTVETVEIAAAHLDDEED